MSNTPLERPRRCAIYTRKSTTMGLEKDFTSLDAQREACELFVRSQVHAGWITLEDHYDDGGFTGANLERPAFQKLMRDIESGAVDLVIVYKIDRLSRSLLDFARVMERMSKLGVGLVSVTQNFSTTDAMGRLTLNMLMSFAEYEREMIAERTRDKIAAARRRGKWTGGLVPLGYRLEEGKLVIEEDETMIVREIFSLYVETRSLVHVVEQLRDRGRKTKAYVSKNGNVRSAKAWTKQSVLRVLRNPVMAGQIHSNGAFFPGEHAYSGRIRSPIPERSDRGFRNDPIKVSGHPIRDSGDPIADSETIRSRFPDTRSGVPAIRSRILTDPIAG